MRVFGIDGGKKKQGLLHTAMVPCFSALTSKPRSSVAHPLQQILHNHGVMLWPRKAPSSRIPVGALRNHRDMLRPHKARSSRLSVGTDNHSVTF